MKDTIQPGLETTEQFEIDAARVTRHMGEDLGIYATPFLIGDIERISRDLLQEHVDEGEDSVGTHIDLQHRAAALEGTQVTITVKVTAVDKRAVTLDVDVRDDFEELAHVDHSRFIVEKDRLKERLQNKAEKMRSQ